MLFNSLEFLIFFIIIYCLYSFCRHKQQNIILLVASCIFYAVWDLRFLFLIFISIIVDYFCGLKIYESEDDKERKRFLLLSIFVNLSILGFLKYFNFFADNLRILLSLLGVDLHRTSFNVILPIGISFYMFKTMSYTFDIYRKEIKPTKNFLDYALFVIYFPQILAGPIMRAKVLLPQIISSRKITLDNIYEGCYLIFWGLFQKLFIADNLAKIIDPVFANHSQQSGAMVLAVIYAYSFQIFCDFAGYSNIANGLNRCMGFDAMLNFNLPYFSTNPKEFWQRWHISLSTWLRDYLYIPLGGNRKTRLATYRNLLFTMFLGGLWHGASWTFVIWGIYHGILLIMHRIFTPFFKKIRFISFSKEGLIEKIWMCLKIIFFFHLVCFGWLIFRAASLSQACDMMRAVFMNFNFINDTGFKFSGLKIIFYIWVLLVVQIFEFRTNDLQFMLKTRTATRATFYYLCFYLILFFGAIGGKEFIYFQF